MDSEKDSICELCAEFAGGDPPINVAGMAARLIRPADRVAVFPALGSFVEGYILVCPRRHVRSVASAGPDLHEFLMVYREIHRIVESEYGPTMTYEHGMGHIEADSAGGCVEHAHLHIVPATFSQTHEVRRRSGIIGPQHSWDSLDFWAGRPYLLLASGGDDPFVVEPPPGLRSQHFRRVTADVLEVSDHYDWAVEPGASRMRATWERLHISVAGVLRGA
jgi:diadenosine tetraphosphate (Ap4A) HIT family hydrolase